MNGQSEQAGWQEGGVGTTKALYTAECQWDSHLGQVRVFIAVYILTQRS